MTDSQRVKTPDVADYWKPLAEDVRQHSNLYERRQHSNLYSKWLISYQPVCFFLFQSQMDPSAGIEDAYHHKNNRVNITIL